MNTPDQTKLIAHAKVFNISAAERMMVLIIEAREAIRPLPHINKDGSILVHRDNCDMHDIIDLYQELTQRLLNNLPEEDANGLEDKYPKWRHG